MAITRITHRLILLVVTAGVVPLVVYGVVSIASLRSGTRQSVITGNLNVAARAAEHIELFMSSNLRILQAVGADLQQTRLAPWQQERILRNYILEFPEFRELTLFDAGGTPKISSRVTPPQATPPTGDEAEADLYVAPVSLDADMLPTTTMAVRLPGGDGQAEWLVGELRLEELWRTVDRIRVGEQGFALLVAADGRLIAHGSPEDKPRVARGDNMASHPVVQRAQGENGDAGPVETVFVDARGRSMLAVAAAIPSRGWMIIVEQPTSEAYAVASQLESQLTVVILGALLITVGLGYLWGRSLTRPIFRLTEGTRALADGQMDARVRVAGSDELRELGTAFNSMADRLVELQEDVRKQERQAMFGRVAATLVHDLAHPIQNIGNNCKLILKMFDDPEYRETFRRTVEREFDALKRVLEDLRHLARPAPVERFPIDVNRSIADVLEAVRPRAEAAGITVEARYAADTLVMAGDLFALGRVYRNLLVNAVQATSQGGRVSVSTTQHDDRIRIVVADTGCGIPTDQLGAVFDDFVTTKPRGLGLGLAISRRIVEQLAGTITVQSEVGRGTQFVLEFPAMSTETLAAEAS